MGIPQELLPYRKPNIQNKRLSDPHVVICGAGASIASCYVDKNGKKVPALKNIHTVLGLTDELRRYGFSDEQLDDFEKLFSDIYDKPEYRDLVMYLEDVVRNYFKNLQLPDAPTYYDYLILSLTEKDAIISFNWDPFLMQAYKRNLCVKSLPTIIFPHGNVGVGVCDNCRTYGYADTLCSKCFKPFNDMPLLYPIGQKNYNQHSIIKEQWRLAEKYLSTAGGITVFGYSAPVTDIEAFDLLKKAFQNSDCKEIAPFTLIDLKEKESEQKNKWNEFFNEKMICFCTTLKETILWRNPRVSLEALFDAILQQHPREEHPFHDFSSLEELQQFAISIDIFDMYFE